MSLTDYEKLRNLISHWLLLVFTNNRSAPSARDMVGCPGPGHKATCKKMALQQGPQMPPSQRAGSYYQGLTSALHNRRCGFTLDSRKGRNLSTRRAIKICPMPPATQQGAWTKGSTDTEIWAGERQMGHLALWAHYNPLWRKTQPSLNTVKEGSILKMTLSSDTETRVPTVLLTSVLPVTSN